MTVEETSQLKLTHQTAKDLLDALKAMPDRAKNMDKADLIAKFDNLAIVAENHFIEIDALMAGVKPNG